jgi:DNA-binding HxlR family transcriptional regulator
MPVLEPFGRRSSARTLEVAGEPWSPLIIRDVWVGLTRFDDIQRDLGISRKMLAERRNWLVAQGVLEQRLYSERPPRHEYQLTEKAWARARGIRAGYIHLEGASRDDDRG